MKKYSKKNKFGLPVYFEPLFWSYDFSAIDPEKNKKTVIVQAINYGDFKHWRWLLDHYGRGKLKEFLQSIPATEIMPRTRKLAGIIFSIKNFNYAPRGSKRKR